MPHTPWLWSEPVIQPAVSNSPNYTQTLLFQGCFGFFFFFFLFKHYKVVADYQIWSPPTPSAEWKSDSALLQSGPHQEPLSGWTTGSAATREERLTKILPSLTHETKALRPSVPMRDGTLGSILKEIYFLQGLKLFSKEYTHLFVDSSKTSILHLYKEPASPIPKRIRNALRDNLKNEQTAETS